MALTDLSLDALREYRANVHDPVDFDDFWARTLAESRAVATAPVVADVDAPFRTVTVEDLTFSGYAGDPIRAWIVRPADATGDLPAVVEYLGYNGGRGLIGEKLFWASAGYVHVIMDTRGQGSGWGSGGDTPDPHGSGPAVAGFMTRGILDRDDYYYRRVYTDAVRLLDVVADLPGVDASRIAVTGGSQGGGISVAAAALSDVPRAVMPDVPFLADFRRSAELTAAAPYSELVRFLAVHRGTDERVFETLSYFDGVNFARRISLPALYSVALMDDIVLPSTVFASYNALRSDDRELEVYAFNGHEGGQTAQWLRQAAWLPPRLG
ncbi:acetylxylan esterase [Agromyces sp. SYSU T00194]|uniref:acetylxylan esterase n=1 Tax=Agromyces chitinivorans TaxID=3158560 RepID=UPI0033953DEA